MMTETGLDSGLGKPDDAARWEPSDARLAALLRTYAGANDRKALWQVTSSILAFVLTWTLMAYSLRYSYWITLTLAVVAAGFLLRLFLLQHDLGHGSLFRSKRVNDLVGSLFGVLTVIPYQHFRRIHIDHHSHSGNLDRRGPGCVMILTVREYLDMAPRGRLLYRLRSNPFVVLVLGGPFLFLLVHRVPYAAPRSWRRERRSVHLTSLALLTVTLLFSQLFGLRQFLMIHLPILWLYSCAAIWLFLTQHSFEDAYWERGASWRFYESALGGSSYYKLPKILQWITLNSGFHHVHHLAPKIPNYSLEKCHEGIPFLHRAPALTLRQSIRVPSMALWDEEHKRLIGFRDLKHQGEATLV